MVHCRSRFLIYVIYLYALHPCTRKSLPTTVLCSSVLFCLSCVCVFHSDRFCFFHQIPSLYLARALSVHLHTAAAAHCIVSDQESKHPLEPFAHTTTIHRYHHTLAPAPRNKLYYENYNEKTTQQKSTHSVISFRHHSFSFLVIIISFPNYLPLYPRI